MLPRRNRLTRAADFRRIHAEGRSWANRMLVLYALANGLPYSRIGFSVSKRVGGAVTRNHTKRLLREAVRLQLDRIPAGWDLVLIARRGIAGARLETLADAIGRLLSVARLQPQAQPVGEEE